MPQSDDSPARDGRLGAGPPPRIRPARPHDAAALVAIFDAWSHPQPVEVIEERIVAWSALDRAEVLVGALGYEDRCERSSRFMRSL